MPNTAQNLYKAVHEGKWLSIEYRNANSEITRYWIAVKNIDPKKRTLHVEGFHIVKHSIAEFRNIAVASILSSAVIEGSCCEINQKLVKDIDSCPEKYETVFGTTANLKILNYLIDCNRLDTEPYQTDYALIEHLDDDCLKNGEYALTNRQFGMIVRQFQEEAVRQDLQKNYKLKQLCMNIMSIVSAGRGNKENLYVLAYRRLSLDVKNRTLKPAPEITVCKEFTVDGEKQSIRRFLDIADFWMLEDLEGHLEQVKDSITKSNPRIRGVDDRPYIIALASDIRVDLNKEYEAITKMFEEGNISDPIKAFFGKIVPHRRRRKDYPTALLKKQANLDQLLAIHSAMKYPVTYIQGPPGTGKSYTIVNTIVTAFFNGQTVLFTSYNNHPINTVVQDLRSVSCQGKGVIPFPVLRLGNAKLTDRTLDEVSLTYERLKSVEVHEAALEKNHAGKVDRTKRLSELLERYEEYLQLQGMKDAIESLSQSNHHLTFYTDLMGRQLPKSEARMKALGTPSEQQALELLDEDTGQFLSYLYDISVKCWQRLGEPKYGDLRAILEIKDREERRKAFGHYLDESDNIKLLQRVFPVIATTCISAHKLGPTEPYFDIVIVDEASQCNLAMSLVPILRGKRLMLVGDPQQLNPVILLDAKDNEILKQRYRITEEYDYIKNSIYKTYLANDAVSDELLLRHHYRCCEKIIQFNNRKYYNNQLKIESTVQPKEPLMLVDVEKNRTENKNTAPQEAYQILDYILNHKEQSIGIITPFANQKAFLEELLQENHVKNVSCGTVHAFQGDEKDVILFSTALTDQTSQKTYDWLKNNRELINVATSRARERLIMYTSLQNLQRLHQGGERDDIYELAQYVQREGNCQVTPDPAHSRALGIKPYSTKTETDFLESLNFALDNVLNNQKRCSVRREVAISQVFRENTAKSYLFYSGRFDFVIYERERGGKEYPILAIELDGKEHMTDEAVKARDKEKKEICRREGFELIRVENSYARRYYYIRQILEDYFKHIR